MSDDRVMRVDPEEWFPNHKNGTHALLPWEDYELLMSWQRRAIASMNAACEATGADCCDLIPDATACLRAEVKRLKEDVRFWNETAIEYKRQLNETIRRGPESAGLHIITDAQIDRAWDMRFEMCGIFIDAGEVGIVECKGCGGDGAIEPDDPQVICETCMNCHGHGWIKEEHGDE